MNTPHLSIIIPTHNRSAVLAKNLAALERQTWPADRFEVLVVADSCRDDTADMVAACAMKSPYQLRLLAPPPPEIWALFMLAVVYCCF